MSTGSRKISYQEYLNRDYRVIHAPLLPEKDFYNSIRLGDVAKVRHLCKEPLHLKEGLGLLSDDGVQNMKYHFVISTAIIARICIEGGMQLSEAYSMSDYYIQQCDLMSSVEEISELHDTMSMAYTKRMRALAKENVMSRHVVKCIDYILEHLDERIQMSTLCELTELSEGYLSRLFRKETGVTISSYILMKKLETARNMLKHSDYPIMWISNALAFPSQSYFTRVFARECGVTPARYRQAPSDSI
ncbi:AraC-type DNA-binding protein [Ruminococcaceae bacterium YRB3002]|nr:AraC-type DNA-binding protein [Ruminococcaceae bacterium YRB3002]